MDEHTSIAYLRSLVDTFCEERDWQQSPKDLALGMAVEVGELLEHFQFRTDAEVQDLLKIHGERQAIAHEVAGVLYHVLAIASAIDFDLSAVFRDKMAISSERYPLPKPAERALKAS